MRLKLHITAQGVIFFRSGFWLAYFKLMDKGSPKSGDGKKKRRLRRVDMKKRRISHLISRAKRLSRPELSKVSGGWTYHGFAQKFPLDSFMVEDPLAIDRIDARNISVDEFRSRYESGLGRPVILLHTQDSWMANQRWTVDVRL